MIGRPSDDNKVAKVAKVALRTAPHDGAQYSAQKTLKRAPAGAYLDGGVDEIAQEPGR